MFKPFYQEEIGKLNISIDISPKECPLDEASHKNKTKELAKFYRDILKNQNGTKKVWATSGEWQNYNDEKSFFYNTLLEDRIDEAAEFLKNFWRNNLGLIVKEYAKFEEVARQTPEITEPFKNSLARNYLIWKDLFQMPIISLALKDFVGNPWGCKIDDVLIAPKSVRFHTHAMQIKGILANLDEPVIAEIGGGYGGMAYYLLREMKKIKYFNFDIPETLVLSAYYLSVNYPDKRIYLGSGGQAKTIDSSLFDQYDIFLIPNYLIDYMPAKSVDLFFNSFSLSEMMPATNEAYINEIARITRLYFLHNNMDRKGVFNRGFERIPASLYPISSDRFVLLSKYYDLFHSHFGDYKEFLYRVI